MPARRFRDEDVLEIQAWPAGEGGVVMEIEGEANRRAVKLGQQGFIARYRAESLPDEIRLARAHLMRQLLKLGELSDQPQQRGCVLGLRRADHNSAHRRRRARAGSSRIEA